MNSLWAYFVCCCIPVLLRKPLENCLRAVRYGPHFVQSTKPQFSEVIALQESRRCTATESRRTTCEKARFPACGKCRPSRMAGKWFFRCPDEIWTPGLMPLPLPRFFEKNRVKLLIFCTFLCHCNASADSYVSAKLVFRHAQAPSEREAGVCVPFPDSAKTGINRSVNPSPLERSGILCKSAICA